MNLHYLYVRIRQGEAGNKTLTLTCLRQRSIGGGW
jgi:hypothetical protein